jgi:hypothetical protein
MPVHVLLLSITYDEAIKLVGLLAWPTVVVVLAIVFRRSLIAFFEGFAGWAKGSLSKVSLPGGFAFELVKTTELKTDWTGPGGQDLRNTVAIGQFASDARDALSLLQPQASTQPADYAVFVLGSGKQWLTSRLHLFSMVLRRMHGLRHCVFVYDIDDVSGRYLGSAKADAVRWSMAIRYPHLEQAACKALLELGDLHRITSSAGALDTQSATTFINNYLAAIQIDLQISTTSLVNESVGEFAKTLREGKGVAEFLRSQLSPAAKKELDAQPQWNWQVNELAKSLNDVVENQSLYEDARFSGITLSGQTTRLLNLKPDGSDRTLLNRLLLSDAFPKFVEPLKNLPPDFTSFNDGEWVELKKRDFSGNVTGKVWEHARWLDRAYTERLLRADMGRDQVGKSTLQAASRKDQVSIILRAESPMVALVDDRGRFVRLIDRLNLASRAMEFSL